MVGRHGAEYFFSSSAQRLSLGVGEEYGWDECDGGILSDHHDRLSREEAHSERPHHVPHPKGVELIALHHVGVVLPATSCSKHRGRP